MSELKTLKNLIDFADQSFNTFQISASDKSLEFSGELAKKLSVKFNKSNTAKLANNLTENYFKDIKPILSDECKNIDYTFGGSYAIRAMIGRSRKLNKPTIFVDDYLHFWLLGINFICMVKACYNVTQESLNHLNYLLKAHYEMLVNPVEVHKLVREEMRSIFVDFADVLPAANAHTVTQTLFTICHEIAHNSLDHIDKLTILDDELEADTLAQKFLARIHVKRDSLDYAQVDQSTLCSPCLMFIYLRESVINNLGGDYDNNSHPSFQRRILNLSKQSHTWPEKSLSSYTALRQAFLEINEI